MAVRIRPNATNPQFQSASVPMTATTNFTFGCWVRLHVFTSGNGGLPICIGNATTNGYALAMYNKGCIVQINGVAWGTGTEVALKLGVWHHVLVERVSTTWKVWRDGITTGGTSISNPVAPTTRAEIKGLNLADVFDVCDLFAFDRLLTQDEKLQLAAGVSPSLLSRDVKQGPKWHVPLLDGFDGTDISPGGVHLRTIVGAPAALGLGDCPEPVLRQRNLLVPTILTQDPAGSAPVNTVAPVASGTPDEGQTLSCTDGTWTGSPAPTYTYQWQYNDGSWNNIVGATASTWTVDLSGAVDAGDTIRCVVTATNGSGAVAANSNSLGPVTAVSFADQYLGVSVS